MSDIRLILRTRSQQKLCLWNRLSRRILGPVMDSESGDDCILVYNQQGEIISHYAGDYNENDLIAYCLSVAALDLRQFKVPVNFSQYAGTI